VVAVKEWVVMLAALSVAVPGAGPAGDDNARNAKVDTEPRHMESG
jgi:hypothetical protein